MKRITLSVFILFISFAYSNAQIYFIENQGQTAENILYEAELGHAKIFLESDKWTFSLIEKQEHHIDLEHNHHSHKNNSSTQEILKGHAFQIHFEGANSEHTKTRGFKPAKHWNNYFIGKDQSKWASNVPLFEEIEYTDIYEKIDLRAYSQNQNLRYDFIVRAGGNPEEIIMDYEGLEEIKIQNKQLILKTSLGNIRQTAPYAYQIIEGKKEVVPCLFTVEGTKVSFDFPNGYHPNYDLIIDPELIFSTYSGSSSDNWGFAATYDAEGHAYGAGVVFNPGYPTTTGSYDVEFNLGGCDVGITKFSPNGTELIYSTYLGGNGSEVPQSMIVNNQDELILMGITSSANFPALSNSFDNAFAGGNYFSLNTFYLEFNDGSDLFITRFHSSGTSLVGSTYLGGSENDGINNTGNSNLEYNYGDSARGEIWLDGEDNIYIGSNTRSEDISSEEGVLQNNLQGGQDGLLAKFNPDLTNLEWYTYIGGTEEDAIYSIRTDEEGNIYACGGTQGSNFLELNGLQSEYNGGQADGFVLKLSNNGEELIAGTFIGTNSYDQTYLLDLDNENNVYVFGQTTGNYPVSENVYSNAGTKQFIHKLNTDLSQTEWSTTIGSGDFINIAPSAFTIGNNRNIYLSGWGGAANIEYNLNLGDTEDLPVTVDAFDVTTDGSDFYFISLSENAELLNFATYFGNDGLFGSIEHSDGGLSRISKDGMLYQAVCAGCGGSDNFPTTPGVWSNENGGPNCNLALVKYNLGTNETPPDVMGTLETTSSTIHLYPTVSDSKIHIDLPVSEQAIELSIFNALGQKVSSHQTNTQHFELDLASFKAGLYFVKIEQEGIKTIKKFIKTNN